MRKAKEDPELAEVKAVLRRLQRLDLHADEDGRETQKRPEEKKEKVSQTSIAVFDRKRASIVARRSSRKSGLPSAIYYFAAFALFAGGRLWLQPEL